MADATTQDSVMAEGLLAVTDDSSVVVSQDDPLMATTDNQFLLAGVQTIEVNGDKHTIVSQGIDQQTGEQLVILASESGNHFALPMSALQVSGVAVADDQPVEQASAQIAAEAISSQSENGIAQETDSTGALVLENHSIAVAGQANVSAEESAEALLGFSVAEIANTQVAKVNGAIDKESTQSVNVEDSTITQAVNNSTEEPTEIQTMVGNDGAQYVIMADSGASGQVDLSEVIAEASSGQGYVIQAEESVVQSGPATHTNVVTDGMSPAEEAIVKAITATGNLTEGQIFQCIQGDVTMAYQIGSTSNGELSLIQLDTVPQAGVQKRNVVTPRQKVDIPSRSSLQVQQKKKFGNSITSKPTPKTSSTVTITRVETGKTKGSVAVVTSNSQPSLLDGTIQGPTQLASSRRTYSKKNILWVNPDSSRKEDPLPALLSASSDVTISTTLLSPTKQTIRKNLPSPPKASSVRFSPKAVTSTKLIPPPSPDKKTDIIIKPETKIVSPPREERRTLLQDETRTLLKEESKVTPQQQQKRGPGRPRKTPKVDIQEEEVISQEEVHLEEIQPIRRAKRSSSNEKSQDSNVASLISHDGTTHQSDSSSDDLKPASSPLKGDDLNTSVRRSGRATKRKVEEDFITEPDRESLEKRPYRKAKVEDHTEDVVEVEVVTEEKEPIPKKKVGFRDTVTEVTPIRTSPLKNKDAVTPSKKGRPSSTTLTPILKATNYTPKGKRLATPLVTSFNTVDPSEELSKLRESISSIPDQRSVIERYDVDSDSGTVHVRQQSMTYTPGSGSSYSCQKCGFSTARMSNLVHHHKQECPFVKSACMMLLQETIKRQQYPKPFQEDTSHSGVFTSTSLEEPAVTEANDE